ncbi:hypothetical protein CAOG_05814 [Capsaspora owczarzaki ATCC 30864]|uniref:Fibronectin type-III domain-containing protein n=1 Tax=Capsaspora owczarzaki (strain ATCC 30864) TaxID=595528 RepID=A0A0D2UJT2_CAPO3|nr:hypothetical protein CAOG_05814 [Capsaspora owczarzaki ATCC 30864]KJE95361.1 hypothetical protein CAOG_005814 [Capsaspora owczarzaki ATCC 30864]|eukprot:XP_004345404.2 hypothetical protein CAOG_05814 [Capsaspora owczarzaki ATCC 30864]
MSSPPYARSPGNGGAPAAAASSSASDMMPAFMTGGRKKSSTPSAARFATTRELSFTDEESSLLQSDAFNRPAPQRPSSFGSLSASSSASLYGSSPSVAGHTGGGYGASSGGSHSSNGRFKRGSGTSSSNGFGSAPSSTGFQPVRYTNINGELRKLPPEPVCELCCRCCTPRVCLISIILMLLLGAGVGALVYWVILPAVDANNGTPTVVVGPGIPDPPAATAINSTHIQLVWEPPNSSGTDPISYYELLRCNGGNGTLPDTDTDTTARKQDDATADADSDSGAALSIDAADPAPCTFLRAYRGPLLTFYDINLNASTTYCYAVRAASVAGIGNFSAVSCVTTLPPDPPLPPTSIVPTGSSTETISIEWNNANGQGAPILAYFLQYKPSSSNQWIPLYPVLVQQWSIIDLSEGTSYDIQAAASNIVGMSNWSSTFTFHTDTNKATVSSAPGHPASVLVDVTYATIAWTAPASDGGAIVTLYDMNANITSLNGSHAELTNLCDTPTLACTLGMFSAGDRVCVAVRAKNSQGWSEFSAAECFQTLSAGVPATMPPPVELAITGNSISLGWTPPDDKGSPIQRYTLQRDDWWNDSPIATIHSDLSLNFTDDYNGQGLLPATVYNYRIRAENLIGPGNFSLEVGIVTEVNGTCGNPADVALFKSESSTLRSALNSCFVKCLTRAKCTTTCVATATGLSLPCSSCWEAETTCAAAKCVACDVAASTACHNCVMANCYPATVVCAGLPQWAMP